MLSALSTCLKLFKNNKLIDVMSKIGNLILTSDRHVFLNSKFSNYRIVDMYYPLTAYSDLHTCSFVNNNGYFIENIWNSKKVHYKIHKMNIRHQGFLLLYDYYPVLLTLKN